MRHDSRSAQDTTPAQLRRQDVLLLLRRLSGKVLGGSSEIYWTGATKGAPCRRDDLHVPDASADPASRARLMSHLRHGPGTGDCVGRSATEYRIDRHDAPVLD